MPLNRWPDRPEALMRTMRLALEDADLMPADVDVVYASANASEGSTPPRRTAIQTLFGDAQPS